jgi:hypothetical protein
MNHKFIDDEAYQKCWKDLHADYVTGVRQSSHFRDSDVIQGGVGQAYHPSIVSNFFTIDEKVEIRSIWLVCGARFIV